MEAQTAPPATKPSKIAIPVAGGSFSEHFGGAEQFFFFGGDPLVELAPEAAPEHRPGVLPRWLGERGVDAVVASAIGVRALDLLEGEGIRAYLAEGADTPQALAGACAAGRLVPATRENTRCGGHHEHGDHSHDGHDCSH